MRGSASKKSSPKSSYIKEFEVRYRVGSSLEGGPGGQKWTGTKSVRVMIPASNSHDIRLEIFNLQSETEYHFRIKCLFDDDSWLQIRNESGIGEGWEGEGEETFQCQTPMLLSCSNSHSRIFFTFQ